MKFRKIGVWKKNDERGFYVEAIEVQGEKRYGAVNPAYLWEEQSAALARGEAVEIDWTQDELYARLEPTL